MKTNSAKNHPSGASDLPVLLLLSAIFLAILVLCVTFQPVMESRTYNRLTGADTTWWDALWVELRVQDSPSKP
jgi:hypothetical protein